MAHAIKVANFEMRKIFWVHPMQSYESLKMEEKEGVKENSKKYDVKGTQPATAGFAKWRMGPGAEGCRQLQTLEMAGNRLPLSPEKNTALMAP